MRKLVFILSLFTIHHSLIAQPPLIARATEYIKTAQYDKADRYLDSILKKDKKNVDALMMKGNVILNRDLLALPEPQTFRINDESIFSAEIYPPLENRKVIAPQTVAAVEQYWRKCLTIDSTRIDIYKGLCTLYALALMKDELKQAMFRLAHVEKDEGEQAFNMGEYARKVKERGKFDDAMQIYARIAEMYPHVAGVRCDIASEYYYEGRINEALVWLDSTFNFKMVDETSFLNGAFIYSELGYFDDAQSVLNTYSKIYQRKMDQFYFGLRQFADSNDACFETLKAFIETTDSNAYYTEHRLAQQLLEYKTGFTLNHYRLFSETDFPDFYKVLIHQRAIRQFAGRCEPYLIYGIHQNSIRNYPASVQFLEEGENCKMSPAQTEMWMLNYGFALYKTGQWDKVLPYYKPLLQSNDSFTAQAAGYFIAKALIELNRKEEAKTYLLQIIADSKEPTKYGSLAAVALAQIK